MKYYFEPEVGKKVEEYANDLMEEHAEVLMDAKLAKIAYMVSYPDTEKQPKMRYTAKIKKANDEVYTLTGYNYIVTVDGVWWDNTPEMEDRKRELLHVLMHIEQKVNNKGEEAWKKRRHDIEEFSYIKSEFDEKNE